MLEESDIQLEPIVGAQSDSKGLPIVFEPGAQRQPLILVFDADVDPLGARLILGVASGSRTDSETGAPTRHGVSHGDAQVDRGSDAIGGISVPNDGSGGDVAEIGSQSDPGGEAIAEAHIGAKAVGAEGAHRSVDPLQADANVEALAEPPPSRQVEGVIGAGFCRGHNRSIVRSQGGGRILEGGKLDVLHTKPQQARGEAVQEGKSR